MTEDKSSSQASNKERKNKMSKPLIIYSFVLFIITSLVFNWFFLFKKWGIQLLIFNVFLITTYEIARIIYNKGIKLSVYSFLGLFIIYFSSIYTIRANSFVLFLSFCNLSFLLPLYFILSANPNYFRKFSGLEFLELIKASTVFGAIFKAPLYIFKQEKIQRNAKSWLPKVLIGIFVTLPIIFIVLLLLSSADPIFSDYVRDFIDLVVPDLRLSTFFKIPFSILVGFLIWSYFTGFIHSKRMRVSKVNIAILDKISVDLIIPSILFIALNFIYLVFVIVQFQYLFGGENFIRNQGLIYSEYAIKGFWEMIIVTLINYCLLYVAQTRFSLKARKSKLILAPLYIFTIFSSLVMIFSSHSRIALYEQVYGFTVDRLIPHAFLIFEVLIMFLLGINIFFKDDLRRKVLNIGTFLITIVFLVGFTQFSMEKTIVKNNIEKFYEEQFEGDSKELDLEYIVEDLGLEGSIALLNYMNSKEFEYLMDSEQKYIVDDCPYSGVKFENCIRKYIKESIAVDIVKFRSKEQNQNWQSWNLQYALAKDKFEEVFNEDPYQLAQGTIYRTRY
ncbi:DUF4173 domain-containing protein [Candidatus Dojkabacteria bacterium]|nr:DUF4173 domain-containing protein [Candidatus Dojkabacteria bacterium]